MDLTGHDFSLCVCKHVYLAWYVFVYKITVGMDDLSAVNQYRPRLYRVRQKSAQRKVSSYVAPTNVFK